MHGAFQMLLLSPYQGQQDKIDNHGYPQSRAWKPKLCPGYTLWHGTPSVTCFLEGHLGGGGFFCVRVHTQSHWLRVQPYAPVVHSPARAWVEVLKAKWRPYNTETRV